MSITIGFVGQGWIGTHYADDFELRGYDVVRYGLEKEFAAHREKIAACDIVFIAVPTPTTPDGFDDRAVREALSLVGEGNTAVIKSTITVGTTETLQNAYPDIVMLHSPEFLREATAAHDAAHPDRNIVGIPSDSERHRDAAACVLRVLPHAPYEAIVPARDAEFIKYAGNCFLYTKVVFMNLLYDYATHIGGDWERIREAMVHDPRIGSSHVSPVHKSNDGRPPGRGAGGHCFIKDFEVFRERFNAAINNTRAIELLDALIAVNNQYLVESEKDIDLLEGVYGTKYVRELRSGGTHNDQATTK